MDIYKRSLVFSYIICSHKQYSDAYTAINLASQQFKIWRINRDDGCDGGCIGSDVGDGEGGNGGKIDRERNIKWYQIAPVNNIT